jgi:hypothetical protein
MNHRAVRELRSTIARQQRETFEQFIVMRERQRILNHLNDIPPHEWEYIYRVCNSPKIFVDVLTSIVNRKLKETTTLFKAIQEDDYLGLPSLPAEQEKTNG